MALRKALTYSKKYARPYTRVSRAKGKSYIKVVPPNKVVKYTSGDTKGSLAGKYPYSLTMLSEENIQIRDSAIEASRQLLTKQLDEKLPGAYFLAVMIHPHHILRNNKTAAGAGADRLSSGMRHSFGVVEGRAAMVKAGHKLFVVSCVDEAGTRVIRTAMTMTKAKLPCKVVIRTEKKK